MLTVIMNSWWADVGPALGSCAVLKTSEDEGSLSQAIWLAAGRPNSPVCPFCHNCNCCAANVGSKLRLSRVFVELTVNDDVTRGWS